MFLSQDAAVRSDADVHEHVIQQLAAVRLTLRGVEGAAKVVRIGCTGPTAAPHLREPRS